MPRSGQTAALAALLLLSAHSGVDAFYVKNSWTIHSPGLFDPLQNVKTAADCWELCMETDGCQSAVYFKGQAKCWRKPESAEDRAVPTKKSYLAVIFPGREIIGDTPAPKSPPTPPAPMGPTSDLPNELPREGIRGTSRGTCSDPWLRQNLYEMNKLRRENNASPLACSESLSEESMKWSQSQCRAKGLSHANLSSRCKAEPNLRTCGENVASNWYMGSDAGELTSLQWENSPGHKKNMINPKFTLVGIGMYDCSDGGYFGTNYWTQVFGGR